MANTTNRDEFTPATKRAIERQARGHCSNPACRRLTHAATSDGGGEISIGEAAHICAAASGGPRYDEKMTREDRRSAENGIWLCDVHARAVDSKDSKFTVEQLHEWKRRTNEDSWRSIMHNVPYGPGMQQATPDELTDRLRAAASADLVVFRQTAKWPVTTVALTLKVDHIDEALSTRSLANAVTTLDDLILVAAPGMGKTTTVFQVAEGILEIGNATPLVVPLGDWATEGDAILATILKRPAFTGISETDFRAVAAKRGVVLMLDGWNELDAASQERARVQITNLKTELPELGLMIATRKQALNIPFVGTRVDLLPLSDEQQMEIAQAMRGETGERLVDQAWRTSGVRELVSIPLYLTALLSLPEGVPFPTTKEEVLRRFIVVHEHEARRAATLYAVTYGFQQDYLNGIAMFATMSANTAITEINARRSVTETTRLLVADGQLSIITTQPEALLNTLVSNHVLMRSGDTPGYSFQHQQFQEWYASHYVEQQMLRAIGDPVARNELKADVLNRRAWEEAILFAIERAARGDAVHKTACGCAILAAFEVDPILAAEMIFRATDDVWVSITGNILGFVEKWHKPAKVDRAVRFMITSGRPEFGYLLWPLVSHENDQIHLTALRAAGKFRPSVFGSDIPGRIGALPLKIRKNVLHEIASESGMDGLDLATAIAKADNNPNVKATVVEALAFRRADRHVADLLSNAGDATYDILAEKGYIDDVAIEAVQQGLKAARARRKAGGVSHREHLWTLIHGPHSGDRNAEISDTIAQMEIDRKQDGNTHLLDELIERYPQALAEGLLRRVRENRTLFYGTDNILAAAGFTMEDEAILNIALGATPRHDDRAEAAASVLGPIGTGEMIDAYLASHKNLRDSSGKYVQSEVDRYHNLRARIRHVPGASLIAAVQTRAATTDNEEIAELAGLFAHETYGDDDRARPFSEEGLEAIGSLAQYWGDRMLVSGDANRRQVASIATLISHAPSATLLPLLKKLLDDNLRRYRVFHEEAKANGWRHGEAVNEARWPHTHEYYQAFLAITSPETVALMEQYLADEHFGELAATVLANQWSLTNEPKADKKFWTGVDFTRVEGRRTTRNVNPAETSAEAEMIFGVIDTLVADGGTEEQKKLAVVLGILGARLPHGQRDVTIRKLIDLAPRRARANLLLSLVLSGEDVDIKLVVDGIEETFEACKKEPWILTQSDAYQLREWLRLLPFATPVSEVPSVLLSMPDAQFNPHLYDDMVDGFENSPWEDAEEVLFKLAEDDPRFYLNHKWHATALRLHTESSARRLIDLTARGLISGKGTDDWHWRRDLSDLLSEFPEVCSYVYELLKDGPTSKPLEILARVVAENPNTDGVLMLIDFEIKTGNSFVGWNSIQSVVTEKVPSENWKGAYNVVPVPTVELRQKLLAMTTSGDADDPAARYLNLIDELRDEYGAPESEPRHPDLASGRPWPILN